jgi:DNA-binding PadR family transcriptional regulator
MCDHAGSGCPPAGSARPNRFVVPGVLLSLAEEEAHGYELGVKLAAIGFIESETDTALIYRSLKTLSEGGYVVSRETPGEGGPPRKVYSLTPSGRALLGEWRKVIEGRAAMLSKFLDRCAELKPDRRGEES